MIEVLLLISISQIYSSVQNCSDQPILAFLDTFLLSYDGYLQGRPQGNYRGWDAQKSLQNGYQYHLSLDQGGLQIQQPNLRGPQGGFGIPGRQGGLGGQQQGNFRGNQGRQRGSFRGGGGFGGRGGQQGAPFGGGQQGPFGGQGGPQGGFGGQGGSQGGFGGQGAPFGGGQQGPFGGQGGPQGGFGGQQGAPFGGGQQRPFGGQGGPQGGFGGQGAPFGGGQQRPFGGQGGPQGGFGGQQGGFGGQQGGFGGQQGGFGGQQGGFRGQQGGFGGQQGGQQGGFGGQQGGPFEGGGFGGMKKKGKMEDLKPFIESFKSGTAAQVSDLKICKDFNNQKSCCTVDFEQKVIAKIVEGFFAKNFEKYPKNMKILRAIVKLLEQCSTQEEIIKLQINKELLAINEEFRKCHKQGIFVQVNILRGTVCSLCVDPAQIDTYFTVDSSSTKLKINSENFNQYDAAMKESFTCFDIANDKFQAFFNSYQLPAKCASSAEKIKEFFTNDQHKIPQQDCKQEATLLGEGCVEQLNDDAKDDTGLRRILSTDSSGYTETANGLNAYLVDSEANAALDSEAQALDLADSQKEQRYLQVKLDQLNNSKGNGN